MSYGIPNSNKFLTLATTSFLFLLVDILYLSVNLQWCQVCTFYCPLRKKRCNLLPESAGVHTEQHNHRKKFKPLSVTYYYGKVTVELDKTQTKNLTAFIMLVI